jgi:hypothetical protein
MRIVGVGILAIIAFMVGAALLADSTDIVGGQSAPAAPAIAPAATRALDPGRLPPGMYQVGSDIPAGTYKLTDSEPDGTPRCYVAVSRDATGTIASIVMNGSFSGQYYITVTDGQYLRFDGAYGVKQ